MKKRLGAVLLAVLFVSVEVVSGLAAVTEPQLPVQTAPPLSAVPTQPGKPVWLTPEKESALVEVRKILRDAKQAAESDTVPNKLITSFNSERRKTLLLEEIERAQLRAGDFTAAADTKRLHLLALAQAQYGDINGAIQTATRNTAVENELLTLVDTFIKAGDIPAAVTVAQSNFAKNSVALWRQRDQAAVYALIARRQHEAGDPEASATLQKAVKAVPEPTHTPDRYLALLHVARTQAILGDRAGSEESFRNALDAGLAQREPIEKVEALRVIAKAQAESGNRAASDQTFQQAIQTIDVASPPRIYNLGCIAWNQITTGNKAAADQTFQGAIRNVESLEMRERGQALHQLGVWQIRAGDLEGARQTVQLLRRRAELLTDAKAKSTTIWLAAGLALRAGDPKLAIALAPQITDEWEQAAHLAYIAKTLISTHDPFGTPEVFQQLAESAGTLLKHSPPKDSSKRDTMRSFLALVQAAAGDVPAALQTADTISFTPERNRAYGKAVHLLAAKSDFANAKRVIQAMEEDWLAVENMGVVRTFTQAQAKIDQEAAALAWARQQNSPYIRAKGLLGVALGIMRRHGIQDADRLAPDIPMRDLCSRVDESPLY